MCVNMLHYLCVGSCITITQSHIHMMQQTHMHQAVSVRVEAKKVSLLWKAIRVGLKKVSHEAIVLGSILDF